MILKPKISWFCLNRLKTRYVYWKSVIVILENPSKTLVVDVSEDQLSTYRPPKEIINFKFFYKIGKINDENIKYIGCIAQELQKNMKAIPQPKA
ncbi:MAG: hypothetical protein RXQ99_09315 [Acidianus sp.]|uniref:hypothetical protein n=1 Tax=Acidianus sp. TaxID=1872104 RepID=UPI00397BCE59